MKLVILSKTHQFKLCECYFVHRPILMDTEIFKKNWILTFKIFILLCAKSVDFWRNALIVSRSMLNTVPVTPDVPQTIPPMKVDEGPQDHFKVKSRSTLNTVPVTPEVPLTIPRVKVDEGPQGHLKVKSRSLNTIPVTPEVPQTIPQWKLMQDLKIFSRPKRNMIPVTSKVAQTIHPVKIDEGPQG